ncbi:hypothetical protein ACJIZ3_003244 [Penstemon smallii]|uniref:Uncharacterized protein n=1 Tax=Penstemon smallii TaxID=265156 RepID=A0ABD3U8R6_9LAMI
MAALARKIGICLFPNNYSSLVCKTHVSISLYFSTDVEKQSFESTPTVSNFLINKHHFSSQSASQVASVVTHLKNPQNSDLILSFLKDNGFSITQLEKIMKHRPEFLNTNFEKIIKPKIKIFQDLGFPANDIAHIISNNPATLHRSLKNRIIPALSVLKGLLGSNVEVAKVLRNSSWVLSVDLESNMVPNIEFLKSCGIPMKQIISLIYWCPRFFLTKLESMRKFVDKAAELGVDRSSRTFFYAVRVVGSMSSEIWELKLKAFRDLGFSEDDILRVFRCAPAVFSVSELKIKKVKAVLVETGKYNVSCIVNNPTSLKFSVETRYKPRLQILRVLEKRNLIKEWPSLPALYQMSDKKFYDKFVAPFISEIGKDIVCGKRDMKLAQKDVIKSKSR